MVTVEVAGAVMDWGTVGFQVVADRVGVEVAMEWEVAATGAAAVTAMEGVETAAVAVVERVKAAVDWVAGKVAAAASAADLPVLQAESAVEAAMERGAMATGVVEMAMEVEVVEAMAALDWETG